MDETIGSAELRLLRYVEEHGPLTVRAAWEAFGKEHGVVRTTVLQMMERLRKKGLLAREAAPGGWRYRATKATPDVERGLIDRLVQGALGGSVSPMVQYLSEANLSPEDVAALRALADRLEDRP
jgi:predicted transcriptional regulator